MLREKPQTRTKAAPLRQRGQKSHCGHLVPRMPGMSHRSDRAAGDSWPRGRFQLGSSLRCVGAQVSYIVADLQYMVR